MSIPKFNLSKLRESVVNQQAVTRKDIANLLLLDRLQSMVKKQSFEKKKAETKDDFVTISIYFQVTSLDGEFYIFDDEILEYKSYPIDESNIMKYLIFDKGNYFNDSEYPISSKNLDGISVLFLSNEKIEPEVDMYINDTPPFTTYSNIEFTIQIPLEVAIHNLRTYRSSYAKDKDQIIPQYSEEMGNWKLVIESSDDKMDQFYQEYKNYTNEKLAKDVLYRFNNSLKLIQEVTQAYSSEDDIPYINIDYDEVYNYVELKLPKVVGLQVYFIKVV